MKIKQIMLTTSSIFHSRQKPLLSALLLTALVTLTGCLNVDWPDRKTAWLSDCYHGCDIVNKDMATSAADGLAYYGNVNADNLNLASWKSDVGFDDGPDYHAIYGNLKDLRIARDLHCTELSAPGNSDHPNDYMQIACYVSNHGAPPVNIAGFEDSSFYFTGDPKYEYPSLTSGIEDAINGGHPWATVAMVWDNFDNDNSEPNNVRFFVFDADGNLVPEAALDTEGAKAVPEVCVACHGGDYDYYFTNTVKFASFLPFDPCSYQFSNRAGYRFEDQADTFAMLNTLVVTTYNPMSPNPMSAPAPKGSTQCTLYVPPGWVGHEKLYTLVVKPYCQICHQALKKALLVSSFDTYDYFAAVKDKITSAVCGVGSMPHALVPYARFWNDPLALQEFRSFVGTDCPS